MDAMYDVKVTRPPAEGCRTSPYAGGCDSARHEVRERPNQREVRIKLAIEDCSQIAPMRVGEVHDHLRFREHDFER